MIICSCKGVSDRTIKTLVRDGNITVEALGLLTGAGSDCGMCVNALHVEIDQLLAKEPEILARVRVGHPSNLTSPAPNRSY